MFFPGSLEEPSLVPTAYRMIFVDFRRSVPQLQFLLGQNLDQNLGQDIFNIFNRGIQDFSYCINGQSFLIHGSGILFHTLTVTLSNAL